MMQNSTISEKKCLILAEINPSVPRNTRKLILTHNQQVFDYYQNNVELHPDEDKVDKRYAQFLAQNYKSQTTTEIFQNINNVTWNYKVKFFKIPYVVGPGIYPSNQFRSSRELHKIARTVKNKRVLDYGCSNGFVGLACDNPTSATFVDINPQAITYLKESAALSGTKTTAEMHLGNMPALKHTYDVVFFNPPFHLEDTATEFNACLQDDSSVRIVEKFWDYIDSYTHSESEIYCSFSNKDPRALELLESSIAANNLNYEMVVHKYKNSKSDVRIYKITKE